MNIPKMTDEQIDKIWWVHRNSPYGFARALLAARDAQVQAALAEQDWYAQQREKIVAANAYDAKGTPAAQERPLSDVECWELGKPDSVDRAMAQERAEPVAPAVGEEQQELLRRVRGYVEDAAKRYYDGTDGEAIRKNARSLLLQIDRALLSASPPAPAQPRPLTQAEHEVMRRAQLSSGVLVHSGKAAQQSPEPSKPEQAEALKVAFEDPRVQTVYGILCSEEVPPRDEHWEGFAARRIVDALATLPPASAAWERVGHHEAYTYDELFQAIAAATKREGGGIGISVQAFRAALATKPQAEQEATPPAQTVQDKKGGV